MKFNSLKILSKPYKKKVIFSLVSAFVLIITNYFVNNFSLFTGESSAQYFVTQKICNWIGLHDNVDYGDAIYFNISYDKQLVPAYKGDYENKEQIGNNIITDRAKLYSFLSLLRKTDQYKYTIIDLAFDDVNDVTNYDDSLFNLIGEMRDIVFAKVEDIEFSRKQLLPKQARAIYYTTPLETNFVRYQYSFDTEQSIASYVFSAHVEGKQIKRYGFPPFYVYTSNGNLCNNSVFLTFDNNFIGENPDKADVEDNIFSEIEVHNLGDYLNAQNDSIFSESFIDNLISDTDNRYVVICNTRTDDIHDTYVGYRPGAQILMRAIASLEDGKHYVSYLLELGWFIVFFFITLCLIFDIPNILGVKKLRIFQNKFSKFILSIISYSFVLLVLSICEYAFLDRATSLVFPELYFTFINLYQKFNQTQVK